MWNIDYVVRDINDLYKCASDNETTLLPSSSYEFWADYVANSNYYDRMFRRRYKNFVYFDQDTSGENPVFEVLKEFKNAVEDLFFLKHDEYDELYKIKEASLDMNIQPFNDYKITEVQSGTDGYTKDYTSGEREDEDSRTSPEIIKTTENEKMAYNSSTYVDDTKTTYTSPEYTEEETFTKGEQNDTEQKTGTYVHNNTITGVKNSAYENLTKANKYWETYEFYNRIFDDICKYYLLIK